MKKTTLLLFVSVFLIGVFAAFHFSEKQPEKLPAPAPASKQVAPAFEKTPAPAVRLPVSPPPSERVTEEKEAILPALDKSDAEMKETLAVVVDQPQELDMFIFDNLIRRGVLLVDSLTRPDLSYKRLPVYTPHSPFLAVEKDTMLTISPENYRRYSNYVVLVEKVDLEEAVEIYHRYYPLFQKAYRELGYSDSNFNKRLIEVIDHLLSAPDVTYPIRLEQPHIRYQYADPRLEALSSGQKLLIRMGPGNAEVIRTKLRQLRSLVVNPLPDNG